MRRERERLLSQSSLPREAPSRFTTETALTLLAFNQCAGEVLGWDAHPGVGHFCFNMYPIFRAAGLPIRILDLEMCAFLDFEDINSPDFHAWAELQDRRPGPAELIVTHDTDGSESPSPYFRPGRIYLDVTELDLQGVEERWWHVQREQTGLGTKPPSRKRGRPLGVPTRRETVLGKTWEEIRAEIRREPGQVTRRENVYIAAEVARKESKWLPDDPSDAKAPDRLKLKWRRQAKDNFYHQVIVHRTMRDLNLRPRRTGRPRKN